MNLEAMFLFFIVLIVLLLLIFNFLKGDDKQKNPIDQDELADFVLRQTKTRKYYYTNIYLKSQAWQRKRYVVLRRDQWRCVYCENTATQVHHKKYAKNIGKEPIAWLESVCKTCHEGLHGKFLN